ncbi:hypothetical protein MRX96_057812 [Rhipicephalus microplus]
MAHDAMKLDSREMVSTQATDRKAVVDEKNLRKQTKISRSAGSATAAAKEPLSSGSVTFIVKLGDGGGPQRQATPGITGVSSEECTPAVDTLKMLVLFAVIVVISCVVAYEVTATKKHDDKIGESHPSDSYNLTAVIALKLLCVMKCTPEYGKTGDVAYSACHYIVYYAKPDTFDPRRPYGIRVVKIIVGLKADDTGSGHHDESGKDRGK